MRGGGSVSPPEDIGGGGKALSTSDAAGAVVQQLPPSREFRRRPVPGSEPRATRGSVVKQLAKACGADGKVQRPVICGLAAGSPRDGVVDMEEAGDGTTDATDDISCPSDREDQAMTFMVAEATGSIIDSSAIDSFTSGIQGRQEFIAAGSVDTHMHLSNSLVGDVGMHLDSPSDSIFANGQCVDSVMNDCHRGSGQPQVVISPIIASNSTHNGSPGGSTHHARSFDSMKNVFGNPVFSSTNNGPVADHHPAMDFSTKLPYVPVDLNRTHGEENAQWGGSGMSVDNNSTPKGNGLDSGSKRIPNAWTKPSFFIIPSKADVGSCVLEDNSVQLDNDRLSANSRKFEGALVGRLFGRRLPFHILNGGLHERWDRFGPFKVMPVGNDSFICVFENSQQRDAVLLGGPWTITGQVLGIDKWTPEFSPASLSGFVTPIWVRLVGLPMYCWDPHTIASLACAIGDPLGVDAATQKIERSAFARVCVRIDLSKPLKAGIWANGLYGRFFQKVEYEGLTQLCFNCGHVGHKVPNCKLPLQHRFTNSPLKPHNSTVPGGPHPTGRGSEFLDKGKQRWVPIPTNVNAEEDVGQHNPGSDSSLDNVNAQVPPESSYVAQDSTAGDSQVLPQTAAKESGSFLHAGVAARDALSPSHPEIGKSTLSPPVDNLFIEDEGFLGPWIVATSRRKPTRGQSVANKAQHNNNLSSRKQRSARPKSKPGMIFQAVAKKAPSQVMGAAPPTKMRVDEVKKDQNGRDLQVDLGAHDNLVQEHNMQSLKLNNSFQILHEQNLQLETSGASFEANKKRKSENHSTGGDDSPRGVRKAESRNHLQELWRTHRPSIVALMETRVETFTRKDADRLLGKAWEFLVEPSCGKSGGIIVLWQRNLCSFQVISSQKQLILGKVQMNEGLTWQMGIVYASKDYHTRRVIWNSIELQVDHELPFLVGGDFNCIIRQEEKRGGKEFKYKIDAREFEEFITNNSLHDTSFEGPIYTWCNNKEILAHRIWVRHDRILLNSQALSILPGYRVQHLIRTGSDHCPLLLTADNLPGSQKNRWIKFEDTWLSFAEASKLVHQQWNLPTRGSHTTILKRKCYRTLRALKLWSGNMLLELQERKKSLERKVSALQLKDTEGTMNEIELEELLSTLKQFNQVQGKICTWWQQRAKVKWLDEGDRNTTYFHSAASARCRSQRISSLTDAQGLEHTHQESLLHALQVFFTEKWQPRVVHLSDFPQFMAPHTLPDHAACYLTRRVDRGEIQAAVFELGKGKTPGLDGITGTFFQGYWDTVGNDVINAALHFFHTSAMPSCWKKTIITLIPKCAHPRSPADFRPISLCTTIYKIIAKVLVNRMKPYLHELISLEQGAFIPHRSIADNCLLAQEMVHRLKTNTSKDGSMAIKFDMEQAYDKMSWECLELTMKRMGFPDKWISWIMACVVAPTFSILVNGERTEWISAHCGFRQGCPLSPFLFVLCSQLLSWQFQNSHPSQVPRGIQCSPGGPILTHLLYADDILVTSMASVAECKKIQALFHQYCLWTGQAVNVRKCQIMFSKAVPPWKARRIANRFEFTRTDTILYLGISLKLSALRRADFSSLIQRIHDRIRDWGVRSLSLAGRLVLINSVLLMIPVFTISHCLVPTSILQEIGKIARHFLWKGKGGTGMHYVAWENLCKPKSLGGLGIHNLEMWQPALMARHSFKMLNGSSQLLANCIHQKYGATFKVDRFLRNDSNSWRILCKGYSQLKGNLIWNVKDGKCIDFIEDRWLLGRSILQWPTTINMNSPPPPLLAEFITAEGEWDRTKLLLFFDENMVLLITQQPINRGACSDTAQVASQFSGRSVTASTYGARFEQQEPWRFSWVHKLKLRPRETLFWWRMCWNALPTLCWLQHRRLATECQCPWGCSAQEDREHVLLHCSTLLEAMGVLQQWGIQFLIPNSLRSLFRCLRKDSKKRFSSFACTAYCYVVYQCWRSRLSKTHGRPYASPAVIAATVMSNITCGLDSTRRHWGAIANSGIPYPSWCPPPPGWIKANFDGSLTSDGLGGYAVVLRDHLGQLIGALGGPTTHWDAAEVELKGLLALKIPILHWDLQYSGMIIEGDCANIISFAHHSHRKTLQGHTLEEDRDISFFGFVHSLHFVHVPRECNRVADCAAHHARTGDFCWVDASLAPPDFCSLLLQDCSHALA